jgi:predicted metal-dependent hydrolase
MLYSMITCQGRNNDVLEFNENEDTSYQNLHDTIRVVIRGKCIGLSAPTKKLARAYTSSLTTHLKALEQKEANTPKRNRQQEINTGQKTTK